MAGIPNADASEDGEKQCDRQKKNGSNSPETEKRNGSEDGESLCNFFDVQSADS